MMARRVAACGVVLAGVALVLAVPAASAQDKKMAPEGKWEQQGGPLKMEFCDKKVLKLSPHGGDQVVLIVCSYSVAKDPRVQAKVTEVEGAKAATAKEIVPIGLEFSFTWQFKDGVATLGDVQGRSVELLNSHLEGKFDKK